MFVRGGARRQRVEQRGISPGCAGRNACAEFGYVHACYEKPVRWLYLCLLLDCLLNAQVKRRGKDLDILLKIFRKLEIAHFCKTLLIFFLQLNSLT